MAELADVPPKPLLQCLDRLAKRGARIRNVADEMAGQDADGAPVVAPQAEAEAGTEAERGQQ